MGNKLNFDDDARYGLHGKKFGQLLYAEEINNLANRLLAVDISPELEILASNPASSLQIKIPTLGFSDPIFDYSVKPFFLLPASINGYCAHPKNAGLSSAKLYGVDLLGVKYQILLNPYGKFDYDLIESFIDPEKNSTISTTLSSLIYEYKEFQVLNGQGLLNFAGLANKLQFVMPEYISDLANIELSILNKFGTKLSHRKIKINSNYSNCSEKSEKFAFQHMIYSVISKDFVKNNISNILAQGKFKIFNSFTLGSDLEKYADKLQEVLVSSILNNSLPIFSLKEFFKVTPDLLDKLDYIDLKVSNLFEPPFQDVLIKFDKLEVLPNSYFEKQQGKTYGVTKEKLNMGGELIKNFSFSNNDKLDLTSLIKELNLSKTSKTYISTQKVADNQLEVWLQISDIQQRNTEQYKVATLLSDDLVIPGPTNNFNGGSFIQF